MAALSPAAAGDLVLLFVALLTVLLAVSLVAVVRVPPWTGSLPAGTGDEPGQAKPRHARHVATRPAAAPPAPSPTAPAQPGQADHAPRGGAHRLGAVRPRAVAGRPPWGPAPEPPDAPGLAEDRPGARPAAGSATASEPRRVRPGFPSQHGNRAAGPRV